jgi:hypothetical protein
MEDEVPMAKEHRYGRQADSGGGKAGDPNCGDAGPRVLRRGLRPNRLPTSATYVSGAFPRNANNVPPGRLLARAYDVIFGQSS